MLGEKFHKQVPDKKVIWESLIQSMTLINTTLQRKERYRISRMRYGRLVNIFLVEMCPLRYINRLKRILPILLSYVRNVFLNTR